MERSCRRFGRGAGPDLTEAVRTGWRRAAGSRTIDARRLYRSLVDHREGYEMAYGALTSFLDVFGPGGRLSVTATWGGHKRIGLGDGGAGSGPAGRPAAARRMARATAASVLPRGPDRPPAVVWFAAGSWHNTAENLRLGAPVGMSAAASRPRARPGSPRAMRSCAVSPYPITRGSGPRLFEAGRRSAVPSPAQRGVPSQGSGSWPVRCRPSSSGRTCILRSNRGGAAGLPSGSKRPVNLMADML